MINFYIHLNSALIGPKFFLQNLKIVGDITCDINGSVPTTIRSTTIEEPNYWIERYTLKEIDENIDGIAVMAVDNLPSELPSKHSNNLISFLIFMFFSY